jgi:hypothetical protein
MPTYRMVYGDDEDVVRETLDNRQRTHVPFRLSSRRAG